MTKLLSSLIPAAGTNALFVVYKTANHTALPGQRVLVGTDSGVITILLPANPATGVAVSVWDADNNAGVNNITIGRNGQTIDGVAADDTLDVSGGHFEYVFDGTTWKRSFWAPGGLQTSDVLGRKSVWIPVHQMYAPGFNAAGSEIAVGSSGSSGQLRARPFDPSAVEAMMFDFCIPNSMDVSAGFTFTAYWSPATTNTGDVDWRLYGLAYADGDAIDQGFSANGTVVDTANGTIDDMHITAESSLVSPIGTVAKGNPISFHLRRSATSGTDTFTGDARLHGIMLHYTTDALNDD